MEQSNNRRIAVLLTSHNRRASTLRCLDQLFAASLPSDFFLDTYLVDDGSTDQTAEAVAERFPGVHIFKGDGSLFWCRGMHMAHDYAEATSPDYFLWLNDDTFIEPNALRSMVEVSQGERVVVGAAFDPDSGDLSYAGLRAVSKLRPFRYERVWRAGAITECEAMNGNLVLVPRRVASIVGNLDPKFEHAMGDSDYALRARAHGFAVVVAPGVSAHCSRNSKVGTFEDRTLPPLLRWKLFRGRKHLPPRSWAHFVRRHGGPLWPLYFAYPYAKFLLVLLVQSLAAQASGRAESVR